MEDSLSFLDTCILANRCRAHSLPFNLNATVLCFSQSFIAM